MLDNLGMKKQTVKTIVAVVVILAGVDVGITYFVGQQSEKAYRKTIELLNNTPGVQATVVSFNKGFFRSAATSEVIVGQDHYNLQDTLINGPIAIDFKRPLNTRFCLAMVKSELITPTLNVPVEARVVFPFWGGAHFFSEGKTFQYTEDAAFVFEVTGWKATGFVNSKFDTFHFQNEIPTINIISKVMGDKDKTQIKDITLKVDYQQIADASNLKVHYIIGAISSAMMNSDISKLNLEGDLDLKSDNFDTLFKMNFDKLVFKNENIGPVSLQLKLEHLDKALFEFLRKVAFKTPISSQDIEETIKTVLKRGVVLKVDDTQATFKDGTFVLQTNVSMGGPELKEPITMDSVMADSTGNLYVSLPKSIFNTLLQNNATFKLMQDPTFKALDPDAQQKRIAEEMIRVTDNLKKNEILTETDQASVIKFSFAKGHFMVEGKEVPKPSLE